MRKAMMWLAMLGFVLGSVAFPPTPGAQDLFDDYEDPTEGTSISAADEQYEEEPFEEETSFEEEPFEEETSFEEEFEELTSPGDDFDEESTMLEYTGEPEEVTTSETTENETTANETTGGETTGESSTGEEATPLDDEEEEEVPVGGDKDNNGDNENEEGSPGGGSPVAQEEIPPQDPDVVPPSPGDEMVVTVLGKTTVIDVVDIYDGVMLCGLPDGRVVEIYLYDFDNDGWISYYECYVCLCGWLGYRYYDYTPDQVYNHIGNIYNIDVSNTYEQTGAIRPTPVDRIRGVLPDTGGPALIGGAVGLAVVGAALVGRYSSRRP